MKLGKSKVSVNSKLYGQDIRYLVWLCVHNDWY